MANWSSSCYFGSNVQCFKGSLKFRWKGQGRTEKCLQQMMGPTLRCSEHQSLKWTQRLVYISTKWCWVVAWNARSPVVDFTSNGPAKLWVTWSLVCSKIHFPPPALPGWSTVICLPFQRLPSSRSLASICIESHGCIPISPNCRTIIFFWYSLRHICRVHTWKPASELVSKLRNKNQSVRSFSLLFRLSFSPYLPFIIFLIQKCLFWFVLCGPLSCSHFCCSFCCCNCWCGCNCWW